MHHRTNTCIGNLCHDEAWRKVLQTEMQVITASLLKDLGCNIDVSNKTLLQYMYMSQFQWTTFEKQSLKKIIILLFTLTSHIIKYTSRMQMLFDNFLNYWFNIVTIGTFKYKFMIPKHMYHCIYQGHMDFQLKHMNRAPL